MTPFQTRRRPLPALVGLVAIAAVALGCASTPAGWTYAPAPPPTPVPSADASGSAAPPASEAPSGSAPASAAPSGGGGGGTTVTIVAQNIQFTTPSVTAPSTGFTLAFDNEDAGTPHDVQLKDASGKQIAETEIFPGVATKTVEVGPLPPGDYPFVCTVHSNMTGTLTVK
jgi:plastocyanin